MNERLNSASPYPSQESFRMQLHTPNSLFVPFLPFIYQQPRSLVSVPSLKHLVRLKVHKMLKVPFVTSIITLLLLTARTWAECILYTPNIGTGIVNDQPFEVYWVGCVVSVAEHDFISRELFSGS